MGDRQLKSQPLQGNTPIVSLTAAFICLRGNAGWAVLEHNRRLHFVAVLPPRTAAAGPSFPTGSMQNVVRLGSWMHLAEHTDLP